MLVELAESVILPSSHILTPMGPGSPQAVVYAEESHPQQAAFPQYQQQIELLSQDLRHSSHLNLLPPS